MTDAEQADAAKPDTGAADTELCFLQNDMPDRETVLRMLSALDADIFADAGWGRAGFEKSLCTFYDRVLLCREKGGARTLLGYALFRLLDDAELLLIGVDRGARGRGIGSALILRLLRECAPRTVFLEVREGNAAARRLYERCGFSVYGRRRGYYAAPREDAVLMRFEPKR